MILVVDARDSHASSLSLLRGGTVPYWGGEGALSDRNYSQMPGKGYAKILADDLTGLAPAPNWRPTNIQSDNRIAAFSVDSSVYYFKAPANPSSITITVKLIFRRFFKAWMDEKKFDIPDIIVKNDSMRLTTSSVSSVRQLKSGLPQSALFQNYPNPFNNGTIVKISLNQPSMAKLLLYDLAGREVKTLVNEYLDAGDHLLALDLSAFPSGMYFYRLVTDHYADTKKMLFVK